MARAHRRARSACDPAAVLVASTGVIGVKLDMAKVARGITAAATRFADRRRRRRARDHDDGSVSEGSRGRSRRPARGTFRVGGMAKGSGMIEPMHGDDARLRHDRRGGRAGAAAARAEGRRATTRSTRSPSTASARPTTASSRWPTARAAWIARRGRLSRCSSRRSASVCQPLAIGIVRGGEGATKLVTVQRDRRDIDADARLAARAIANSPLVKTAIHGGDPNWGRLVAAAGRSGADVRPRSRRGAHRAGRALQRRRAARRARRRRPPST